MIQLDIDGPDVVLEAGAVFGGDTAEGDEERADQSGQTTLECQVLKCGLLAISLLR